MGQGVQLVGIKQGDLEGCKELTEEIVEGKAEILLLGGVRRVWVGIGKLRTDVVLERVEVLPADFAEVGLHAQLGIRPGATKEDVKAAYKKMVLKLHPNKNKNNQEKAMELFNALNTANQNWKGDMAQTWQGGGNQAAPQPHHTNFQFNPTYCRLNFLRAE